MTPHRGEHPSLSLSVILFAVLLTFAVVASAQSPEVLRLSRQQAIDEALAHNPALAASRAQVEEARANVVTAAAFADPTFVADVAGQSHILNPASGNGSDQGFGITLPFPGKRGLRRDVATADLRAAEFNLTQLSQQVASQAAQSYDAILVALRHREDLQQVTGFRLMMRNDRLTLSISDEPVRYPVKSDRSTYIRRALRGRIASVDVLICMIGNGTAWRDWVEWEIEMAAQLHRDGKLALVNCGHVPAILAQDGQVTHIEDGDMPVGLIPEVDFHVIERELPAGSRLCILTDGISETENAEGAEFGTHLIANFLCHEEPMREIMDAVQSFGGNSEAQDDRTLVVLERIK